MVILGGAASLFVGNAFQAQMPEFAHDLGSRQADFAYSALLAANAAGAVFGGFLLEGKGWLPPNVEVRDHVRHAVVRVDHGVCLFY